MPPLIAPAGQHLLGTFPTYAGAEQLVDTLSNKGFPVEHTRIVGIGLRSIEQVTGRVTPAKAAAAGAASGAWFGFFIGLVLGLFSRDSSWVSLLISSTVMGTLWFSVFGYVAQRATRGRRDFASTKAMEAEEYQVYVDEALGGQAALAAGLI